MANAIIEDLNGAKYYMDPDILAGFLAGSPDQAERAKSVASDILADLNGAAYYKDATILANFLRVRLGLV